MKQLAIGLIVFLILSCSQYRHNEYYKGTNEGKYLIEAPTSSKFVFALSEGVIPHTRILVKSDTSGLGVTVLQQEVFKGIYRYQAFNLNRTTKKDVFNGDNCILGLYDENVIFTCLNRNKLISYEIESFSDYDLEEEMKYGLAYMMENFNLLQDSSTGEYNFSP